MAEEYTRKDGGGTHTQGLAGEMEAKGSDGKRERERGGGESRNSDMRAMGRNSRQKRER